MEEYFLAMDYEEIAQTAVVGNDQFNSNYERNQS